MQCKKLTLISFSYNVTNYMSDHPGGEKIIMQYRGRDATKKFKEANHSDYALKSREPL